MELNFKISNSIDNTMLATDLKNWLRASEIQDIYIYQNRKSIKPDEAGGILEAIVTVVVGAPATVALIKSFHIWMQEKTKRIALEKNEIKITLENEKGHKIIIESNNFDKDQQEFISKISKHISN